MHWCHAYCCLLHSCCLVLSHNTLYFLFKREHVSWWDQITVAKETTLTAVPLAEKKIKLIPQWLVAPKIEFHLILLWKANWNSVVSPIKPNQRYIAISNKWRYNDQEKRIIFQRGLLDWLLPIWTLPPVCEICDKMQVVYKKLTCDTGKLHGKFTISHIKFHVNFFQWGWTKQLEYVINGIKIVLQIHLNHQYHSKLQTYWIIVCLQALIFRGLQHQRSFMANRTAIFQFNSTHAVHKLLLLLTTMAITTN